MGDGIDVVIDVVDRSVAESHVEPTRMSAAEGAHFIAEDNADIILLRLRIFLYGDRSLRILQAARWLSDS